MIPHDTIDTLIECFEALSALGTGLDADDWELATDLPQWTVKDNLSHLIGIERVMQGYAPTQHTAADLGHVKNPIGTSNEHEVDARRQLTGEQVLAEWDAITAERIATLRTSGDDYFDAPAMTPTGPGTVADFLHIRVLDCWLHEQDMRRAVHMPGHLSGRAAEHTIDRLLRTIPIVVGKRAGTPEGGAVELVITGGVDRHVVCEVRDGRAAAVPVPTAAPLASISLDTESFVVLATGRRTAATVSAHVSGDAALAQRVLDQMNMMI
jgi:uncharacterized protein (TIGR03083 family)